MTEHRTAPGLLLMAPGDNCLIARHALGAGEVVDIDGHALALPGAIQLGHKVARRAIRAGEKVLRYGAIIGTATRDIAQGAHIHTHNLVSDYLPTYTIAHPHHD